MEDWRKKELEHQENLIEVLMHALKGNEAAVRFCIDITFIAHVWDDLVDRDKERTSDEISNAFKSALVDIPSNPFYLANINDLRPLMMNVILQWQDANKLEVNGNTHDKHMAFMLRASFIQLFVYCAFLCGGGGWAETIGPEIRRIYQEDLFMYLKEFENA